MLTLCNNLLIRVDNPSTRWDIYALVNNLAWQSLKELGDFPADQREAQQSQSNGFRDINNNYFSSKKSNETGTERPRNGILRFVEDPSKLANLQMMALDVTKSCIDSQRGNLTEQDLDRLEKSLEFLNLYLTHFYEPREVRTKKIAKRPKFFEFQKFQKFLPKTD